MTFTCVSIQMLMNVDLDWTTASKHVQTHLDHITVAVSLDLNWKGFLTVQVR